MLIDPVPVPNNVRHNGFGRRQTVGLNRLHVAADQIEKPPHVGLRVVKAPGTAPTITTGVDRFVAVRLAYPCNVLRSKIECTFPRHRYERLRPAFAFCITGSIVEPPGAYHRLFDAQIILDGLHHARADGRGVWVIFDRGKRG